MIIESGRVSMGTGAPLPPEVFVVVNSMKTLVTVSSSVILLSRLSAGHRFDKVHLVAETQKTPVDTRRELQSGLFFSAYLGLKQTMRLTQKQKLSKFALV